VIKGLTADSGGEAAAAGAIGAVSIGTLVSVLLLKPVESMERNGVFVPWLIVILNTYWTRLVYFSDPSKIDEQLRDAAEEAEKQLAAVADKHAAALGLEKERLVALAGTGGSSDGAAKGGWATSKDEPAPTSG